MKKLRDWSLRHKILLHVGVIGILTAVILTVLLFKAEMNLIRTLSLNNTRMTTSLVQNSMTCYMKSSAEKWQNRKLLEMHYLIMELFLTQDGGKTILCGVGWMQPR